MTIISGHQRYKASKDLGIAMLPVLIKEDLIDETEKLKKLLAANFGRLKNNPVKQGRVYAEYEKLCGVRGGSANKSGFSVGDKLSLTQEDIAKELGVDVRQIQRLKRLESLSPELQQLIEDGEVRYTTALNVWGKLSHEDQTQLIETLGKEHIATLTAKETEQAVQEQVKESTKKLQEQQQEALEAQRLNLEREIGLLMDENEKLKEQAEVEVVPEELKNKLQESQATISRLETELASQPDSGLIKKQLEIAATKEKELQNTITGMVNKGQETETRLDGARKELSELRQVEKKLRKQIADNIRATNGQLNALSFNQRIGDMIRNLNRDLKEAELSIGDIEEEEFFKQAERGIRELEKGVEIIRGWVSEKEKGGLVIEADFTVS